MSEPTALERIREVLRRAREAAPDGPGLMPQPRVPQDQPAPPPHWSEGADAEREDETP